VIWIGIHLESIEGFDANVDVFRESLNDPKPLGKRSAALELKRQAKLFEPKDGVHDPVVFLHESRIIDLLALCDGLDKCLEVASLMQKKSGMLQHLLKLFLCGVFAIERNRP
jgi:hypothetical protein